MPYRLSKSNVMKTKPVPLWACHLSVICFEEGFQRGKSGAMDKTLEWLLTRQCSRSITFLVALGSSAADNLGAYLYFWTKSLRRWAPRRQCWCQSLWFLTKTPELPIPSESHCQSLQILQNPLLLSTKCFNTQLYFPLESLPSLLASQCSSCSPATTTGPPVRRSLLCLVFDLSLANSPARTPVLACHSSCSAHPAAASLPPPTLSSPLLVCHGHLRVMPSYCHDHLFPPSCPPGQA